MRRGWPSRAVRALRRRGPVGFVRLVLHNVRLLLNGQAGRHRYVHDDAWDRANGVDTAGTVAIDELTAPDEARPGAVRYEPTPPECFAHLLAEAGLGDLSGSTFIDIGSGKGRVVLLAGLAGFQEAIGVEFGEELHVIARRNIEIMGDRLAPARVATVRADARTYVFPSAPTVCFINNPFGVDGLAALLDGIEASLRDDPRPFTIIYYHSNHAQELHRRAAWQAVSEGVWRDDSHHFAIFRCEQASARAGH